MIYSSVSPDYRFCVYKDWWVSIYQVWLNWLWSSQPILCSVILLFLAYRKIHSSPLVTLEVVANYSLLYHVRGSNSSLTPYLLMGHLDVVRTVNLITLNLWKLLVIILNDSCTLDSEECVFMDKNSNNDEVWRFDLQVPADDGDDWDAPPFSGRIVNDYIYGRGAIDNKQTVFVSILWFLLQHITSSCRHVTSAFFIRTCYNC